MIRQRLHLPNRLRCAGSSKPVRQCVQRDAGEGVFVFCDRDRDRRSIRRRLCSVFAPKPGTFRTLPAAAAACSSAIEVTPSASCSLAILLRAQTGEPREFDDPRRKFLFKFVEHGRSSREMQLTNLRSKSVADSRNRSEPIFRKRSADVSGNCRNSARTSLVSARLETIDAALSTPAGC